MAKKQVKRANKSSTNRKAKAARRAPAKRKPAAPVKPAAVKKSAKALGWGILGTGRIAKALARAINASTSGRLVAVGSRSAESAAKFGQEFAIAAQACYGSYEAVLADPHVDVVYISLPNHLHALWADRCAEAGKHILCEKPLGMNFPEAMRIIESARYHDVFLMEAFMYRCHPQIAKLVELIRRKAIGEVRVIQANFAFNAGDNWEDIRTRNEMGGGGIMDVGCYTASLARLVAGAAVGKDFADPIEVKGCAQIGQQSRVDHWAVASAKFPGPNDAAGDILATLTCGMSIGVENVVRIFGTAGSITLLSPWIPGEKDARIVLQRGHEAPQTITVEGGAGLYTLEVDTVARNIKKRQPPSPCMSWADSLSNMKMLDEWRRAVGLVFDPEKPEALTPPIAQRPLQRRPDQAMSYGQVAGVDKPVSRVVMGSMIFQPGETPLTQAMLDHFFEVGGNCIDTAYVYGTEPMVGRWLKTRGVRQEMVILGKGAHTPKCDPVNLSKELQETLERLQVDHLDIYLMHRDNLDIPVGEFVDVLNEHKRAGRIRAFGGSNWTTQRLQAANDYAQAHGLTGFAASSPNFSLARWNRPTWDGCIAASDAESRAWYEKSQMPIFSWSSQAQGFFTGRYRQGDQVRTNDWYVKLVAPIWFNDDNFQRLQRAQELAARKGVTATQIAMAYVLNQPFPVYAIIGPRTIEETRTSLEGIGLQLTPEELRWLNLEN